MRMKELSIGVQDFEMVSREGMCYMWIKRPNL